MIIKKQCKIDSIYLNSAKEFEKKIYGLVKIWIFLNS